MMTKRRSKAETANASEDELPRVIVFDLDGTLWDPEMYQLHGGAPFKPHASDPDIMIDRRGTQVHLIGETRRVLQEMATDPKWSNTHLAISSTCDEPLWAAELMRLYTFTNAEGAAITMGSLFSDLKEIYYASKSAHHSTLLEKIRKKDRRVTSFKQMLFFDNQTNNIRSVSALGVPSCYCANGMTTGTFERGLEIWRQANGK